MSKRLSVAVLADRLTIRQQMALLTAALCLLTIAVVASSAAVLARRQAIQDAQGEVSTLSRAVAARLDQHMADRYREIRNVASFAPLADRWSGDPAAARGVLEQIQTSLPEYAWLGVASTDGTVRAATRGMLEGMSVAERPWFKDGIAAPSVEDVHDAKLLDKLLRTSPDAAPFRFVDIAMPLFAADGMKVGVLGAHLSWSFADELRRAVLSRQDPALESDVTVLSAEGVALLGPVGTTPYGQDLLAQARGAGTVVFTDTAGSRPMLTSLSITRGEGDYPGLGWYVAVRRPTSAALGPANRLAFTIAAIGAAIALLGIALAYVIAGGVTRPLMRLAGKIDLIGRDPSVTSVDRQHGSRDVLQLSAALRSLLRRVGTAEEGAREANRAVEELQRRSEEQLKAADERTRRLGSDLHTLQALADTDPLTGLLNRRAFLPFAEDAFAYFRRYQRALGILMFDIDHFKKVNDTFGHGAGDEVIRVVGEIIATQLRSTDKVARFGGEEFVVLLREVDQEAVEALANRIRERIGGTTVIHGLATVTITISIGAAMAADSDRDIQDVIERADKALYDAKSLGRNQVVMRSDAVPLSRAA
jgi:diguanylate cyclase (GGDEF)-like protein